jgi:succinyl-diaminopimelate desuccinylase
MLDKIVSLTKKLILIPSEPHKKNALDEILNLSLSYMKNYTVENFSHNGFKSALVYNVSKRPKKFKIVLNAHLDVVPGKPLNYKPTLKGNKLYGVGSMDMKASVACLIMAFKEVADKVSYPLALQLVTDEEIGGYNGTKYQVDKGVRADFVIAGEPTNFDIVNKAKGVLIAKISAKGKTAHGAYPWRGQNAIMIINEFLNNLRKKFPIPKKEAWVTTVNVSTIETDNISSNKIPDQCSVTLDIRFVPTDAQKIVQSLKKLLPKGASIEILVNEPPLDTDSSNIYIEKIKTITSFLIKKPVRVRGANGTSDARHFARKGNMGIEFGPIGGGIGSDLEYTDITSLEKYYTIISDFLMSLDK